VWIVSCLGTYQVRQTEHDRIVEALTSTVIAPLRLTFWIFAFIDLPKAFVASNTIGLMMPFRYFLTIRAAGSLAQVPKSSANRSISRTCNAQRRVINRFISIRRSCCILHGFCSDTNFVFASIASPRKNVRGAHLFARHSPR